jgi:adenylate kinase family enzyme
VARVLIPGMSGTGKSTLLRALAERGHRVLDTDYDGWILPDGRWDAGRMSQLLDSEPRIAVAGTVDNQGISTIASNTSCCSRRRWPR